MIEIHGEVDFKMFLSGSPINKRRKKERKKDLEEVFFSVYRSITTSCLQNQLRSIENIQYLTSSLLKVLSRDIKLAVAAALFSQLHHHHIHKRTEPYHGLSFDSSREIILKRASYAAGRPWSRNL